MLVDDSITAEQVYPTRHIIGHYVAVIHNKLETYYVYYNLTFVNISLGCGQQLL